MNVESTFDTVARGIAADVVILGAGSHHNRKIEVDGRSDWKGQSVATIDYEPRHKPTLVWDLNVLPWPVADSSAQEIHAYEILEHLGTQGDAEAFFNHFYECWRILKPNGHLVATVPHWQSLWAFGDPSHRRVINSGSLVFLDQMEYRYQIDGIAKPDGSRKKTPMSDFRSIWHGDFKSVGSCVYRDDEGNPSNFAFVLQAIKPVRS